MKGILIAAAIMAATTHIAIAKNIYQFPNEMIERVSNIGFDNKSFTIILTNKCIVAAKVTEQTGSQITFEYKGYLCPDDKMVALAETHYVIDSALIAK